MRSIKATCPIRIAALLLFALLFTGRAGAQSSIGGQGINGRASASNSFCSGDISTDCSQVNGQHLSSALPVAKGGSGAGSFTAHDVLIGEGAGPFNAIAIAIDQVLMGVTGADPAGVGIPNCGDSTHALSYSTTTHQFSCQGISATATPGGSAGAIQYNNNGAMGGVAITGLVKGNGTGAPSAAVSNTDYQTPDLGLPNLTSSKSIAFAASPYAVSGSDSMLYASAGASANTILLLPPATGSKKIYLVMRSNDGNPHHVIARPSGADTVFPNNSGSGSSDLWCDIGGESIWLQDFAAGQWLLF